MIWSAATQRIRTLILALLLLALPMSGGLAGAHGLGRISAQGDAVVPALFIPLAAVHRPEPFCRPAPLTEVPQSEILGGSETAVDGWRCVAAIVYRGETSVYLGQYCGGTLIAPRWVLTAAHCVDSLSPTEVDVVLGRHRLVQTGGEQIRAERFVLHPQFSRNTNRNDIALILLTRPSGYLPAQMIDPDDTELIAARAKGTVVGWGRAEFGYPYELREANVPVVSNRDCNELWFGLVTDNMICAGQIVPHYAGACFGDSGGPLFMRNMRGDGWEQIGIVSWGNAYCQGNYGVYTRLNKYGGWVQTVVCSYTPSDPLCRGDDYESDDTSATAKPIGVNGEFQKRYFHDPGDTDWVWWNAEAGVSYRLETSYLGYRSDTIIDLYDADGLTRLAGDDNSGGGSAASLAWTAPISQTYYARVRHKGDAHGLNTSYYLSLRTAP